MAGILYVVTTPIGNLQDLTPRAAATFAKVDFIAAEDTRVTVKLLNHLGLKKPMVSYYEHNAAQRGEQILDRIAAGESCALCSDAGVPAISDPGEALVADAMERGLPVVPVPAASAAVTALCVSGQNTARFVFEGFLPQNRRQRAQRLDALQQEIRTTIFYEAPHKLPRTMQDLEAAFGPQRSITICRELTKLHEEIWKTTVGQARQRYTTQTPRGEFVLVMAGADPASFLPPSYTLQEAVDMAKQLATANNFSASEAAKKAAAASGFAKSEIYKAMQK
ncbi:16S rRNA (cytidine(1402)-2'-O)-methyltransferase [Ruminococcaceae bacterium OttesenSCG-928-A16]|nr:16S rRNA (cytidine(1402)-2'-O)-methyltransferase [Ruminococcaceae bacterium OttesenSCG-928-A16]